MDRPLLALVMIVKNEESSIGAVLDSVAGAVDHWTICDTGSTDRTFELLAARKGPRDLLVKKPFIPFDGLLPRKVVDFAATRNFVLGLETERSDAAMWQLSMSGDETLVGGAALREFLVPTQLHDALADAYCVMMNKGSQAWQYPRVLRTGGGRRYVNPIHEVPVGKNNETGGQLIPGVSIVYKPLDTSRFFQRLREVDLPILEYIAAQPVSTHEEHSQRARALQFLGMTHENLAVEHPREPGGEFLSHQLAAMAYYRRRTELDGDPSDLHDSAFRYLDIAGQLCYSPEELLSRLQALAVVDPRRPEIRYRLAETATKIDPKQGAFFAMEAVRVAQEAKVNPLVLPWDTRIEWLSFRLAAECSRVLGNTDRMRTMAQKGVAAGGPENAFAEFLV